MRKITFIILAIILLAIGIPLTYSDNASIPDDIRQCARTGFYFDVTDKPPTKFLIRKFLVTTNYSINQDHHNVRGKGYTFFGLPIVDYDVGCYRVENGEMVSGNSTSHWFSSNQETSYYR